MNKLILFLFLFMPILSFGQKFEMSEMGGCSNLIFSNSSIGNVNLHLSNQLSFNYYFTKRIALGVFYEMNAWNPINNSLGFVADAHIKHFYFGANASKIYINNAHFTTKADGFNNYYNINIKFIPAIAYGIHAGLNQKLSRHIYVKEQIGVNTSSTKGEAIFTHVSNSSIVFPNGTFSQSLNYFYLLIGISYSL